MADQVSEDLAREIGALKDAVEDIMENPFSEESDEEDFFRSEAAQGRVSRGASWSLSSAPNYFVLTLEPNGGPAHRPFMATLHVLRRDGDFSPAFRGAVTLGGTGESALDALEMLDYWISRLVLEDVDAHNLIVGVARQDVAAVADPSP